MRFWIYLNNEKIGVTRLIEDESAQAQQMWPYGLAFAHNRVYVCPDCGDAWAKWEMEDKPNEWFAYRVSCGKHTRSWLTRHPGSIVNYDLDLLVIPRALLEKELLLCTDMPLSAKKMSNAVEPSCSESALDSLF
jgi:hypothetical protein